MSQPSVRVAGTRRERGRNAYWTRRRMQTPYAVEMRTPERMDRQSSSIVKRAGKIVASWERIARNLVDGDDPSAEKRAAAQS
ncbi:hypothetical protein CSOJ01_15167 [Colletotrichum sojae]|uniref:Uncharacterized protein n=1 Tax=Colletotrichum sojae TaxID=2175907 RepID=A0A8H6INN1_9PEZI|nr:hypothetical protein CSOJ01_15167 [Colletotrichum sojae]